MPAGPNEKAFLETYPEWTLRRVRESSWAAKEIQRGLRALIVGEPKVRGAIDNMLGGLRRLHGVDGKKARRRRYISCRKKRIQV